jgi:hypothetical protein
MIQLTKNERDIATNRLANLIAMRDLTLRTACRLPAEDREVAIANALAIDWAVVTISGLLGRPAGQDVACLREIRETIVRAAERMPLAEREAAMHNAGVVGWALRFLEAAAAGQKPPLRGVR